MRRLPAPARSAAAMLIITAMSTAGVASASSGQRAGGAAYVSARALPSGMTTAPIPDPALNDMTAVSMTIPDGWKLQGVEMKQPCTAAPSPVFRAASPDGLMQIRQEPMLGWSWNDNGGSIARDGCAKLTRRFSAAEFLRYYVTTLQGGVHVVGPMPVPAAYTQQAQQIAAKFAANDERAPTITRMQHTADTAALRVQIVNGSFIVEERLRVEMECGAHAAAQWSQAGGTCFARVDVLAAPLGKLDALVQVADRNSLPRWTTNREWFQATIAQLSNRNAADGRKRLLEGQRESAAFSQFMYGAFQQNMARSAAQHNAFMQQQERSFQSSMNAANSAMNARSTAASDWVDHALDQQTVSAGGESMKVSSAYSYTWVNGQGQSYQTNFSGANPNGVIQGNWTQATVVHGNGQPR